MIPAAFEYVRAGSVDEAIHLLREGGEDAKLLAGGHSLIPMMKLRFATPSKLIDIAGIPHLGGIEVAGRRVTIGALATHAAIAADVRLQTVAPVLWEAANHLGDPQVRNRGTIGGSAAHADPAADYPAVLLALEATLLIAGADGTRAIAAADFFHGMFETALAHGEVLTGVTFETAPRSAYVKYHHPASHYAVVGAAAVLTLKGGSIGTARIALTGVGDQAFRASGVEAALIGVKPDDAASVLAACAGAASGVEPRADTFAPAAYRLAMADVYAARAVQAAAAR
jgi:aerobic carbon-monoxide dehydrogenase medium subunit